MINNYQKSSDVPIWQINHNATVAKINSTLFCCYQLCFRLFTRKLRASCRVIFCLFFDAQQSMLLLRNDSTNEIDFLHFNANEEFDFSLKST